MSIWQHDFDDPFLDMYNLYLIVGQQPRTIRYYVQLGLIPKATGSGTSARYTLEHVIRLRTVTVLKRRRLTLWQIKAFLDGHSTEELSAFANGADPTFSISQILRYYHPATGEPSAEHTCVKLADGIELCVALKYLTSVAVRSDDLKRAVRELIRLEDEEDGEE